MAKKEKSRKAKKAPGKAAAAKRKPARRRKASPRVPAEQGFVPKTGEVGYGKPPVEHRFAPGQSGNPAGTPAARSNLWRHFCRYLELTPGEVAKLLRRKDLSMAQRAAVRQVQQLAKRGLAGTAWLATREAWNRDEGKPTEHLRIDQEQALTPEECDEIRRAMKGI